MTTLGKPMQRLPRQRLWRAIGCGFVSLMVSAGALAQRDDHRHFDPKANTTGSRTPVSGLQEEKLKSGRRFPSTDQGSTGEGRGVTGGIEALGIR